MFIIVSSAFQFIEPEKEIISLVGFSILLHHKTFAFLFIEYDAIATLSKLKVHDDHELSPSPISTAIYLVQKSSSSLSPTRDDEGYSGSSDVSENPLPIETTIIATNQLIEQYRIHEFRTRQSILSYDVPKRSNASCVSPDVSLV
jgi:hypothetical protein